MSVSESFFSLASQCGEIENHVNKEVQEEEEQSEARAGSELGITRLT